MNLASLAFKNLWQRKMRASLTILGVGTSIAVFVSLVGLAGIFTQEFRQMYAERQTDLVVREKGNFDFLSSGIDESYADTVARMPEVLSVSKVLIDFSSSGSRDYFLVLGFEKGSRLFSKLNLQGSLPREEGQALLGSNIARKMGKGIGDSIQVKGRRFKVCGTFQSRSMFEDGSVIVLLETLQKLKRSPGKVTLLNVTVNKGGFAHGEPVNEKEKVQRLTASIQELLPETEARSVEEIVSDDNMINYILNFAWAVSIIAFIAAILGIINTMVTSVLEQTAKIGILLAVGWRKSRILMLVLYESILLGLLGGACGLFLGYTIMNILVTTPQLQNIGKVNYDPLFMVQVILVSLGVGFLSGIYPALRAVSINIIQALRYE